MILVFDLSFQAHNCIKVSSGIVLRKSLLLPLQLIDQIGIYLFDICSAQIHPGRFRHHNSLSFFFGLYSKMRNPRFSSIFFFLFLVCQVLAALELDQLQR